MHCFEMFNYFELSIKIILLYFNGLDYICLNNAVQDLTDKLSIIMN